MKRLKLGKKLLNKQVKKINAREVAFKDSIKAYVEEKRAKDISLEAADLKDAAIDKANEDAMR